MDIMVTKHRLCRSGIYLAGIIFWFVAESGLVQAQQVTGKVIDAQTNRTLPGVNILIKGTSTGTSTNAQGGFSLEVSSLSDTLVFSFIGYKQKEVPLQGRSSINVSLRPQAIAGEELVVVGYGTEKKKDLTGSVSSIRGEDVAKAPVANVAQALSGKLPGVHVVSQDGRPGASTSIRIRGGGSISQSNEPLYIVDGFPAGGISDIPADVIENITVLKDASATAIYGARGSHGVIIVTTKGAEKGNLSVTYDGYATVNTPPKYFETMNAYDYITYNWAYAKAINDNYADAWEMLWGIGRYKARFDNSEGINYYKDVPATNFSKEVFGDSYSHNHTVTMSYGDDRTKYRLSMNYMGDNGMKVNSYQKRTYVDFNLDQKLGSNLTLNLGVRYTATDYVNDESTENGRGSILSSAYWFRPIDEQYIQGILDPTKNTQLGMYDEILQNEFNPISRIEDYTPQQKDKGIRTNASLAWDVLDGLTVKSAFSLHANFNRTNTWSGAVYNRYLESDGTKTYSGNASISNYQGWNLVMTNSLDYQVQGLGSDHSLNLLVGQELTNSGSQSTQEWGEKYPTSFSADRAFANMDQYLHDSDEINYGFSSSYGTPDRLLSFFGRANYSLLDKYLLTLTFRADGSSRFAPSHRWGYFPAAAVAWRISDEDFLSQADWLSNLKLRVSYGATGDDGISSNLWEQTWKSQGLTGYSIGEVQQPGYAPASSTIANPNLKWETTITRNIGLDYSLFEDRLRGTIDVYKNTTENLLMRTTISAISGYSSTYANVGSTSNQGIELSVTGGIIQSEDFNLNASVIFNLNRGEIEELAEGVNGRYSTQWGSTMTQPNTGDYALIEGKPVGIVRGFVYDGWYTVDDFTYENGTYTLKSNVADVSSGILGTVYGTLDNKPSGQIAYPGVVKYKDLNGDGMVDANDVTQIGNMNPSHTGGFSLNGNYKNFDFTFDFSWSYGNEIYNVNYLAAFYGSKEDGLFRNRFEALSSSYKIYDIQNGDVVKITDPSTLKALNKNATTFLPYQENPIASTMGIDDGSYLRLNNVTLGYTLPNSVTERIGLSSLRLYGTVYNAFVLTNYPGLDPEVNTNTHQNGAIYPTPGLDFGSYPRARSFTLGINVRF